MTVPVLYTPSWLTHLERRRSGSEMRAKPASEYSDDERRELLARQKASGMSIREFAATWGLSGATISHWRWRLSRKAASSTAHKDEPTFVKLAVDRPEPPSQRRCATSHF